MAKVVITLKDRGENFQMISYPEFPRIRKNYTWESREYRYPREKQWNPSGC